MPCKHATSLTTVLMAGLLALAGCSTGERHTPEVAAAPVVQDGRCHSEQAQYTVGQKATSALLEQARTRSGAQIARVLKPNDMVTMDYRSERLNLNTDANGVVQRATCG
ncbi:I78 family peptidase inhibitor [Pseudomonas sp. HR96]|uniref:I78 family peptidase inhibitor n=1 Tax=Pseudomonas sp. HR96 TaxID=1027966 RepID=UPI002A74D5F1|nr:I78 family peptidase inhibitor [Pseudomonas sp. HR96]WPP01634.1 I78 family peptidase inhibitor [Pseudomonas sp. HR96]